MMSKVMLAKHRLVSIISTRQEGILGFLVALGDPAHKIGVIKVGQRLGALGYEVAKLNGCTFTDGFAVRIGKPEVEHAEGGFLD